MDTSSSLDYGALIDLYCERTGPGFWDEPFNAISNVAFVIAALVAWRTRARREASARGDGWEVLLIIMAGLIGAGSFLFHTFATSWAEMADIAPIWAFVGGYILLSIYRSTDHDLKRTALIGLLSLGATVTIALLTGEELVTDDRVTGIKEASLPFNGSLQYAPALMALALFALFAWTRNHSVSRYLTTALLIFSSALMFRTIDLMTCEFTQGIGTHFLWHLLNAVLIGLLLQAMIVSMPPPR